MSRFKFRLASLLRIREALARQEERKLAALFAEQTVLQRSVKMLRERQASLRAHGQDSAGKGVAGVELHLAEDCLRSLDRSAHNLEHRLRELEPRIDAQRRRYATAQRDLEKLATLRSGALEIWKRTEVRREQSLNDDLFLARRIWSRQGSAEPWEGDS